MSFLLSKVLFTVRREMIRKNYIKETISLKNNFKRLQLSELN